MMDAEINIVPVGILRKVDKAGVAVFDDVGYKFLYDPEYQEFLLEFQALPVIMEPRSGI